MFGSSSLPSNLTTRQIATRILPRANPPMRLRAGEGLPFDEDFTLHDLDKLSGSVDLGASSPAAGLSTAFGGTSHRIASSAAELEAAKDRIRTSEEFADAIRPVIVAETLDRLMKAEAAAFRVISNVPRGSVLQGLTATSKGLVLPYDWYGKTMAAAVDGIEALYQRHVVQKQPTIDLTQPGGHAQSFPFDFTAGVPPQCDEVTTPFADCRLAVHVAVVWRMLEQVAGTVAGMSAALRAFERILPAIYDGFETVSHTLPPVTNLAASSSSSLRCPRRRRSSARARSTPTSSARTPTTCARACRTGPSRSGTTSCWPASAATRS
jgi:hypothetical protein